MFTSKNDDSERTSNPKDYQQTCSEFIKDISKDYFDWVDRYNLSDTELNKRKKEIEETVYKTNNWIINFGKSIKKIDIIMNDGINKMAESTAGYPFNLDIYINNMFRYTKHNIGKIKLNVKSIPRSDRMIKIGNYDKEKILLINSSSKNKINYNISQESLNISEILDDYIILDAQNCQKSDVVSITVVVEEIKDNYVTDKRGYSTIILIQ
ncbi:MAG: hypothetical protein ACPKPY_07385 [Nitrososphaeraceae archaeon]